MNNELVLQFSTTVPDWRWHGKIPPWLKKFPSSLLFDKNWASGLIRRTCHSPFSHADLVMLDGTLLGASDFAIAPIIITTPPGNPRGVAQRPFDYAKFGYRRQMIIATSRADDVRAIARTQLGKPFDNGALRDMIGDKFPGERDWRIDDCWFCSELLAWAMETAGMFDGPLPWPKNRLTPTDLLVLFLLDSRWVNRDTFWVDSNAERWRPREA